MRHICAKEFLDLNFNEVVISKISIFHEIAPNFHKNCNFFKYNWKSIDQLLIREWKRQGKPTWCGEQERPTQIQSQVMRIIQSQKITEYSRDYKNLRI